MIDTIWRTVPWPILWLIVFAIALLIFGLIHLAVSYAEREVQALEQQREGVSYTPVSFQAKAAKGFEKPHLVTPKRGR